MKKLTYILLLLFTGNTYAQSIAPETGKGALASNHGKTVSTATKAHVTAEATADAASKGEYIREIARSKKDEASKAVQANLKELADSQPSLAVATTTRQSAAVEKDALEMDAALFTAEQDKGKGQDKAKADKKEASKEKSGDKTKKETDNQGQKVKTTAQAVTDGSKEKGQAVKEVASAKRQEKPEKVEAGAKAEVKAPKSAARPGRGAARAVQGTSSAATKAVGKAVKAAKPVKVGGKVGAGAIIKVGKN